MKLLFLDVDGVLNNLDVLSRCRTSDPIGEEHLVLLKSIVTQTDCRIVLSSTWRLFEESRLALSVAFEEHGIPLWIGITPSLSASAWGGPSPRRADEILSWIRSNVTGPAIAVAIDDDEDIDIGKDHNLPVKFKPIRTSFDKGLTIVEAKEAVDWFTNNNL